MVDKKIKTNGHGASLDARIAAVNASDDCDKAELIKLVAEAEQAITEAQQTIESESAAALDISNPDPDESDLAVRKATRTIARLDQALQNSRIAFDQSTRASIWNAGTQRPTRLKHNGML